MSRNLSQKHCNFCHAEPIILLEDSRPISKKEAGNYYKNYKGLLVANAECDVCGAKYLAWIDERTIIGDHLKSLKKYSISPRFSTNKDYFDLSFRSTFNDEPGNEDLPTKIYNLKEANKEIEKLKKSVKRWKKIAKNFSDAKNFAKKAEQRLAWDISFICGNPTLNVLRAVEVVKQTVKEADIAIKKLERYKNEI